MKVLGSLLAVNVTVLTSAGLYVSTFAPDDATFAELDGACWLAVKARASAWFSVAVAVQRGVTGCNSLSHVCT